MRVADQPLPEIREDVHALDPFLDLFARPPTHGGVAGRAPDRGEVKVVVGARPGR